MSLASEVVQPPGQPEPACGLCGAGNRPVTKCLIEPGRADQERLKTPAGRRRWAITWLCRDCLNRPWVVEEAVNFMVRLFEDRENKDGQGAKQ
jgi:hypothetical protein